MHKINQKGPTLSQFVITTQSCQGYLLVILVKTETCLNKRWEKGKTITMKKGRHQIIIIIITYFDHQEYNSKSAQMSEQFFLLSHELVQLHAEK